MKHHKIASSVFDIRNSIPFNSAQVLFCRKNIFVSAAIAPQPTLQCTGTTSAVSFLANRPDIWRIKIKILWLFNRWIINCRNVPLSLNSKLISKIAILRDKQQFQVPEYVNVIITIFSTAERECVIIKENVNQIPVSFCLAETFSNLVCFLPRLWTVCTKRSLHFISWLKMCQSLIDSPTRQTIPLLESNLRNK